MKRLNLVAEGKDNENQSRLKLRYQKVSVYLNKFSHYNFRHESFFKSQPANLDVSLVIIMLHF